MNINRNNQNSHKREMLYMARKEGSQKEHTVSIPGENGEATEKSYLLQHPGVRAAVQLRGRSKDSMGGIDEEKYYDELMKKVIVKPRTTWEYWEEEENAPHFQEVMKEASTFLMG